MTVTTDITLHPLDSLDGLSRLEQALGLARPPLPMIDRTLRYSKACDAASIPGWCSSLGLDRFGTAMHLLRRREDALLGGWDGAAASTPELADLATVESILATGSGTDLDTEADRLRRIQRALARGLCVMSLVTIEQPERWPWLWRMVAEAVGAVPSAIMFTAMGTSALQSWQLSLAGSDLPLSCDTTLALTLISGRQSVAQALAGALGAASEERRSSTVIICDDPELLASLDDRLARAGLPRLGAPALGSTTALDGLLPLVVALCWEPVDPGLLIEFCLLPDGPLGQRAGKQLATALTQFPGLNSRSWDEAIDELVSLENDPDGSMDKRLKRWFAHQRVAIGNAAPAELLVNRCRCVAAWASARAAHHKDSVSPYARLAGGAASLADLFGAAGGEITAPAAARLMADALTGMAVQRHTADAGAPLLVDHPWRIPNGTTHAIWIAPHANDSKTAAWTAEEYSALKNAGLSIDDGQTLAAAHRESDRRGLCRIQGDLLVIELPPTSAHRRHPAVLELHRGLKLGGVEPSHLPRLDDSSHNLLNLAGWQRGSITVAVMPPQPPRLAWQLPPGGIRDRETHSYSELARRLACPLAWTLTYAAKLRDGGSVSLPEEHILQGTFAHAVLESVFAEGILSPAVAAARAGACFDERIGRDASPLALPRRQAVRMKLRERIVEIARLLAETLVKAGCTDVTMEAPISGSVGNRALSGSIDCLGTGRDLAVIVDLKLGSLSDRRDDLAQGRAIQLALYAATRSERTVAIAYGIVNGRRLLTPAGSAIPNADGHGCEIVPDAPGWQETWTALTTTLDADQAWMTTGAIPARPLEDPSMWPPGSKLVLDAEAEEQTACSYCSFGALCGREGRT